MLYLNPIPRSGVDNKLISWELIYIVFKPFLIKIMGFSKSLGINICCI